MADLSCLESLAQQLIGPWQAVAYANADHEGDSDE